MGKIIDENEKTEIFFLFFPFLQQIKQCNDGYQ